MFNRLRDLVLRLLRVPPAPEPPVGDPSSVRVFRASRKLYWLRLTGWGATQIAALIGIIFGLGVILAAEHQVNKAETEANTPSEAAPRQRRGRHRPPEQAFKDLIAQLPRSLFGWLWVAKGIGVVVYLGQLALSYAAVRLDYEMRWYLVTDRSLRIRSGLWRVQEMTMSFANLQQVVVSQGPLQRLLGIADVKVQSAGGGGGSSDPHQRHQDSMHSGVFHGVENAVEVRDLILNRLRLFRETGLGDPDETRAGASGSMSPLHSSLGQAEAAADPDLVEAARELLVETRRLRSVIESAATGRG